MPMEHAAYLAKPDYKATKRDLTPSAAPCHDDPLTRHQLSYLNGGGGSGKTTRAIELFRTRNPLVFTLTHRLAKEMRTRGVQAQTYHSFFRWSSQTDWKPERMGKKFDPRVIIWDEVCTVPNLPQLARGSGRPGHLQWRPGAAAPNRRRNATRLAQRACRLLRRGRGRPQSQRPPSQGPQEANPPSARQGPVPRGTKGASWMPRVGALRGGLEAMRSLDLDAEGSRPGPEAAVRAPWEVLPGRPRTSAIPPQRHSAAKHHGHHPWALAGWHARPARAPPERRRRGALEICPRGPRRQVGFGRLGSWLRPHRSLEQGITVADPQKVWIIDDFLQWSNLAYLAVHGWSISASSSG